MSNSEPEAQRNTEDGSANACGYQSTPPLSTIHEATPPEASSKVEPMSQGEKDPRILRVSCQCTSTIYLRTDTFAYLMYCHCTLCRRSTGSAFKPLAGLPISRLKIIKGHENLLRVPYDGWYDVRCGKCGSLLYATGMTDDGGLGRDWAHVAVGTLVDEPSVRPVAHVFVGSKAGWFEMPEDGLVRYEGKLPDEGMRLLMAGRSLAELDSAS